MSSSPASKFFALVFPQLTPAFQQSLNQLLRLSWPTTLGLSAVIGFNLLESWLLSQWSPQGLAALSLTFPVLGGLVQLGNGLGVAAAALWVQQLGQSVAPTVQSILLWRLCGFSLLGGGLLTGLLALGGPWLFAHFDPDPKLLGLLASYWWWWLPGGFCFFVLLVVMALLRACGDTLNAGRLMVASAGVNLGLDYLLFWGWGPVPALQLDGLAVAFSITRLLGLVLALGLLWRAVQAKPVEAMPTVKAHRASLPQSTKPPNSPSVNKVEASSSTPSLSPLSLPPPPTKRQTLRQVLSLALPATAANLLLPITQGVLTTWVAGFGAGALAAYGLMTRLEGFALVGFLALSASIMPSVGQSAAKGEWPLAQEQLQAAFVWCVVLGSVLSLGALLGHDSLVALLHLPNTLDSWVSSYLHWIPPSYALLGIFLVGLATFNALGRPVWALGFNSLRLLVLYLPLLFGLSPWLQEQSFFVAGFVSYSLSGIVVLALLNRQGLLKRFAPKAGV